MATTTQNLGLIKPAGTDKIRIAQINSNMDTIDTKMGPVGSTPLQTQATNAASSISALQSGMAIVCNGNTHAAIAEGQYAYVRNHSSLAEGLYKATAAIPANATLSSSNLSAVSGGGLNVLRDNVDTRTLAVQNSEAIAAGATKSFRIGTAYTGYTPIGIVSIFGSGTTGLVLQEFYLDGTDAADAVIYYRNATSNPITPTLIRATILYRRN